MLLSGESFTLFGQGSITIMQSSSQVPAAQRNIVIVFGKDGEHQLVVDRQRIQAEPIDGRAS